MEREQEEDEWEVDRSHHSSNLKRAACIWRLIDGRVRRLLLKERADTCK